MAWQSSTINPTVTTPADDIAKIKNDLQVLRGVLGGTADADVPLTAVTGATVNSIAVLRTVVASSRPSVFVLGYYAPGDGGGGRYYYDAADTTSTDNGGTVIVGASGARWKLAGQGAVNVRQFGAKGDGTTDDSAALSAAIASGRDVYVPAGTYRVGVTVDVPMRLRGAGSQLSVLRPLSATQACIVYRAASPYWTYHSHVEAMGFEGLGVRSTSGGYGFSFGSTDYTGYYAGAEFANNVVFSNCRFTKLFRGVHFPFGNIGTEFYSCSFTENYFGVYSSDNKYYQTTTFPGASLMHGGNKYFYGGQFDNNVCGLFVNNESVGFGGIVLRDTIVQYNETGVYIYSSNTSGGAITLDAIWNEGNGQMRSGGAGSVTIDAWTWSASGPVPSNLTLTSRSLIFDTPATAGATMMVEQRGGFSTDVWLRGGNIRFVGRACRHESQSGHGGRDCTVTVPATSSIVLDDIETSGGASAAAGVTVRGGLKPTVVNLSDFSFARGRVAPLPPRSARLGGAFGGTYLSLPLTTATTMTGSVAVSNSIVSDGRIYTSCNNYSCTFTAAGQLANMSSSTFSAPAGKWLAITLDIKLLSGSISVFFWDASTNRLIGPVAPVSGAWQTLGGIGYNSSGSAVSMYLTMYAEAAGAASWRLSAVQVAAFDTRADAEAFLDARAFIG